MVSRTHGDVGRDDLKSKGEGKGGTHSEFGSSEWIPNQYSHQGRLRMMRFTSKSLVLSSNPARNLLALAAVGAAGWYLANQTSTDPITVSAPIASISASHQVSPQTPDPAEPAKFSVVDDEAVDAVQPDNAEKAPEPEIDPHLEAIKQKLAVLDGGYRFLQEKADYEAKFHRQERIGGEMQTAENMKIKVRHQPFSVYMKWLDVDRGREVLYVAEKNEGKMLFHYGGWKARFLPVLKLDPHGSLANSGSRHPITEAGILELVKRLIKDRRRDIECGVGYDCFVTEQSIHERDCVCFDIQYDHSMSDTPSEVYRRSITFFDKEFSIPVEIKNFTWLGEDANADDMDEAAKDELTLIEHYSFTDIAWEAGFTDEDFSHKNRKYRFRR